MSGVFKPHDIRWHHDTSAGEEVQHKQQHCSTEFITTPTW